MKRKKSFFNYSDVLFCCTCRIYREDYNAFFMQNDAEVRSEAQQKVICFQNLYNKMISPICMQMELTTSKKSQAKTIFLCL